MTKIEHAMSVLASFKKLREEDFNCDFTIKVASAEFRVHQNVLVACSDYFKAMFSHNTKELQCGFVDMKDVEEEGIKQCIDFMYSGEADVNLCNARHILHAAGLMQLHLLTEHCFEVLQSSLDENNCLQVKALANIYSHAKTNTIVDAYVKSNLEGLIKTQDFMELDKFDVFEIAKCDTVRSEVLWKVITSWVKHNKELRKGHFMSLAKHINFSNLDIPFLLSAVWCDNLLQESEECKQQVVDCLFPDAATLNVYINAQNCFLLQEIAKNYLVNGQAKALSVIKEFMQRNFNSIALDHRFVEISQDEILGLYEAVQSKQWHQLHTDMAKWTSALRWVKQDTENRKSILPDLMRHIGFVFFPTEYLHIEVINEPFVKESHECKDIIMDMLLYKTKNSTSSPFQEMKSGRPGTLPTPQVHPISLIAVLDKRNKEIRGFEVSSCTWNNVADAQVSNSGFDFIVTLDNNLYLIHNKSLFVLQCGFSWESRADMSFKHDRSTRVVAFKGHINVVSISTLAHYNPNTNQWIELRQPANFCGGFCLAATESSMYAIGGFPFSNEVRRYDPQRTAWTYTQPMLQERSNASAQHFNSHIFVMGGRFTELILDSVERYNISIDQWTCIGPMAAPRANFASCVIEGKLYAVGGHDSIEVLDIDNDNEREWTVLESINSRPFGLSACILSCWMVSHSRGGNVTKTLIL